ncbi:MAG: DUF4910 domain-containing protein [Parcubacteria group bacterium]|nr:DUF4910 domain-containing protein [Parcubacteria group bacterium]
MIKLIQNIWLTRRDIVSDGFDEALAYISKIIPLKIHKVPIGSKCWTWKVPEKWSAAAARIENLRGKTLLNLKDHPLHVMSYSLPIDKIVTKEELLKHLHTRPDRPGAIPFEFKYYERDWGFCVPHNWLERFKEDRYRVFIDSKFEKGYLKIGEHTIKGRTKETIAVIAHLCHPAMVNDDLSGVAVLVGLAKELGKRKNYFTYKFVLVPETIGSIAYLSRNEKIIPQFKYGIFLEMLGNDDIHGLQLSRQGDTAIDRAARHVMKSTGKEFRLGGFREIVKNDEMVWNGPGVNIPTISVSRAKPGFPHYPEYHTSDDDPSIVSAERLNESKDLVLKVINLLERDYVPVRKFKGPIFLSGYGLWVDWRTNPKLSHALENIMLRMEGDKSILEIADELDLDFEEVLAYIDKFVEKGLATRKKRS